MTSLETKQAAFEFKAEDENDEFLTISGYGAVFGNVDSHGDIIEPGAFADGIKGRKPKMLWQHNYSQPVGAWDELVEDQNGLFIRGRIFKKASKGAEVATLVAGGAIEGLSIGYRTREFEMEGGNRLLTKLDLFEVSIVTFPSNELSNIYAMKSVDDMSETEIKRHLEKSLKEINVSGTMAKAMAAGALEGRKSVLRDADALPPETDQREVDELKALLTETLSILGGRND